MSRVQGLVARSTRAMAALSSLTAALPCTLGEETGARARGRTDDRDRTRTGGGDEEDEDGEGDARALRAVVRCFIPDAVPLLLPLLRCRLVTQQAFACVQGLARGLEADLVALADGYAGGAGTGASGGSGRGMGLERDLADALRIVATVADRPLGTPIHHPHSRQPFTHSVSHSLIHSLFYSSLPPPSLPSLHPACCPFPTTIPRQEGDGDGPSERLGPIGRAPTARATSRRHLRRSSGLLFFHFFLVHLLAQSLSHRCCAASSAT